MKWNININYFSLTFIIYRFIMYCTRYYCSFIQKNTGNEKPNLTDNINNFKT